MQKGIRKSRAAGSSHCSSPATPLPPLPSSPRDASRPSACRVPPDSATLNPRRSWSLWPVFRNDKQLLKAYIQSALGVSVGLIDARSGRRLARFNGYGAGGSALAISLAPVNISSRLSRSYTRPFKMTVEILVVLLMLSSGFASRSTRSASLPVSTVPSRSNLPENSAAFRVAACNASIGVRPDSTSS